MDIQEIVALSVKHNVSDLHLCSGVMARWRRGGLLEPAPFLSPDPYRLLQALLSESQLEQWQAQGQLDFAFESQSGRRLRASAFRHTGGASLALRLLPTQCPVLATLGTPAALTELLREEGGSSL